MFRILFVCHGNICRSPMAEFVMKEIVRRAGRSGDFLIDSMACRSDEVGSDAHPGTKKALRAHGIPFARRRARRISRADYDAFDRILAMDAENLEDLMALSGGDPAGKCSLLLSFAGDRREVADPWYTGDFERTFSDVSRGCEALFRVYNESPRSQAEGADGLAAFM